jgi:hypothetical protein
MEQEGPMATTRKAERKIEADPEAKASSADRGDSPATAARAKKRAVAVPWTENPVMFQPTPLVDVKGGGVPRPEAPTRPTIRELAFDYLKHPEEWLDHPNPHFGGRTPNEMVAAGEEDKVYNMFDCFDNGLF